MMIIWYGSVWYSKKYKEMTWYKKKIEKYTPKKNFTDFQIIFVSFIIQVHIFLQYFSTNCLKFNINHIISLYAGSKIFGDIWIPVCFIVEFKIYILGKSNF